MSERKESPNHGGKFGYGFFHVLIRLVGPYPAYFFAAFLIPYYLMKVWFSSSSPRFYLKKRFPGKPAVVRFLLGGKYLHEFSKILIDQACMGILGPGKFRIEFPYWEELYALSQEKDGMVLLTTHSGTWLAAMASMNHLDKPVNFLLRVQEHDRGKYFFDLAKEKGIKIISPDGLFGGLVESVNMLKQGECVSIMGDRAWGSRTRKSRFLGHEAAFPITPYYLTVSSDARLVMFLTVRTGSLAFRIDHYVLNDEIDPALTRDGKMDALFERYVYHLEEYVSAYPFMWLNFFDFWSDDKGAKE